MKIAEIVGIRLHDARKRRQVTQAGVAHELGIDLRHFQRIESGKANVTLKTLERISEYFLEHPWRLLLSEPCPIAQTISRPLDLLNGKRLKHLDDLKEFFQVWESADYGIACLQVDGEIHFANKHCCDLQFRAAIVQQSLPEHTFLIMRDPSENPPRLVRISWDRLNGADGSLIGFMLMANAIPCAAGLRDPQS